MDVKQFILVEPYLFEQALVEQFEKADTSFSGSLSKAQFRASFPYSNQFVVDKYFNRKKFITFERFRRVSLEIAGL